MRRAVDASIWLAIVAMLGGVFFVRGLIAPVVVVSGSMAPTLLGPHRDVTCSQCRFAFTCDESSLPSNLLATCPNCGFGGNELENLPRRSGDRLIVNRAAFALRPPRRWEIAVFICPENPLELCVKRIAGLPGETLQIRDGDLYVDGQIARKSLVAARDLAIVVHQSQSMDESGIPDGWISLGDGTFAYEHRQVVYGGYADPQVGPILDDSSYNQNESRLLVPIADLMLRGTWSPNLGDPLRIRMISGGDSFQVELAASSGQGRLQRNGHEVAKFSCHAATRQSLLEMAMVDHQVYVALDEVAVLSHVFDPTPGEFAGVARAILIESRSQRFPMTELTVLRDVYYTAGLGQLPRLAAPPRYQLGPDEYFVLGDNSPLSADSRTWAEPAIPAKLIVGKALGR